MPGIQKLLFVDTNIWLDFYRPVKSDAIRKLLTHLESVSDKIICTHQLEMEFKKNRQLVIADGLKTLSAPSLTMQGIFSDAKAKRAIEKNLQAISKRVEQLKRRLIKVLSDPIHHDPVYQTFQRIVGSDSELVLDLDNKERHVIRRKAMRRFLLGCPPRKASDTSVGDAYNWEWMISCAIKHKAELVILSRDSDYGREIRGQTYLNDHLKQEFSERVSKKRKIHLHPSIVEALARFGVSMSRAEKEADAEEVKQRRASALMNQYITTPSQISGVANVSIGAFGNISAANSFVQSPPLALLMAPISCVNGHTFPGIEASTNLMGQRTCPVCGALVP